MKQHRQEFLKGGRVLLGTRVPLSTHLAVAELARKNKRSISAVVNDAVQEHLSRHRLT